MRCFCAPDFAVEKWRRSSVRETGAAAPQKCPTLIIRLMPGRLRLALGLQAHRDALSLILACHGFRSPARGPMHARANALAAPYHQRGYVQLKGRLSQTAPTERQRRPREAIAAAFASALRLRSSASRLSMRAAELRGQFAQRVIARAVGAARLSAVAARVATNVDERLVDDADTTPQREPQPQIVILAAGRSPRRIRLRHARARRSRARWRDGWRRSCARPA